MNTSHDLTVTQASELIIAKLLQALTPTQPKRSVGTQTNLFEPDNVLAAMADAWEPYTQAIDTQETIYVPRDSDSDSDEEWLTIEPTPLPKIKLPREIMLIILKWRQRLMFPNHRIEYIAAKNALEATLEFPACAFNEWMRPTTLLYNFVCPEFGAGRKRHRWTINYDLEEVTHCFGGKRNTEELGYMLRSYTTISMV